MFRIIQFRVPGDMILGSEDMPRFKDFHKAAGLSTDYSATSELHVSKPMATTQKEFFICEQLLRGIVGDPSHVIHDVTPDYSLLRTRAPRDYDYAYVIEIGRMEGEFGEERIVAIPKKSVAYQSGRYSSGLHTPIDCA